MAKITIRGDFRDELKTKLGLIESEKLQPTQEAWEGIIDDSLDQYSHLRPDRKVFQQAGSATAKRFVLDTVITGWKNGTSRVVAVASVIQPDTNDEVIEEFDYDDWSQRRAADGKDILFLPWAIGTTATLRIIYDHPHQIDSTDAALTTVPEADSEALKSLALGKACEWIARSASDLANESLGGDAVDYEAIGERWARRAKDAFNSAQERLSAESGSVPSAGASTEWTTMSELARQPRIGH